MNVEIEVTGINLTAHPKWDVPLTIAAFCDVRLCGLSTTLFGVALARRNGQWIALPPKAAGSRPNDPGVIKWDIGGPVPRAIAEAMAERYKAFGGPTPPAPSEAQTRAANAERRFAEKKEKQATLADFDVVQTGGVTWIGLPKPEDEPEDESGVLRTLRAEAEICDRAGL